MPSIKRRGISPLLPYMARHLWMLKSNVLCLAIDTMDSRNLDLGLLVTLEVPLAERNVTHTARWLNLSQPASVLATVAQRRKATTEPSWRLDEAYVKVRGEWRYLYRAVDRNGQTLDFMLSEHRDEAAAQTISSSGIPRACAIDKSGANTTGLKGMNAALRKVGSDRRITVYRSTYLNKIIEQDHRGVKP